MNYAELQVAVQSALENTFSATDFATYTQAAEEKIYQAVQIPALRKNVTGVLTASNKYLACPTDFIAAYSIAVVIPSTGAYAYLLNKDVSFMRECYPVPTTTGTPRYYALFGSPSNATKELTFIVAPTPDLGYAAELHYFYYPESIVTASDTWLSDNFFPVLLYAVKVEAYNAMKGEADLVATYKTEFVEAIALLKKLCQGLEMSDEYRRGAPQVPVV